MSNFELPICTACGSQTDAEAGFEPSNCKICDDPRQFVPASGQSWTNMNKLRTSHNNNWRQVSKDPSIWSLCTEPKFAVGQRALLLQTPHGNILWDLIALLDDATIKKIRSLGGLKAIVISHPHYYTTYAEWAEVFDCPVYISVDDRQWLCRKPPSTEIIRFIEGSPPKSESILDGITAIKTGGHFSGSLVLHWKDRLFIADTIVTVPSAYTPHPRPPGLTTYSFMWAIPNMIPLPPDNILRIWRALVPYDFHTTHGAFNGMDVSDEHLKGRMLESMKIQVKAEGYTQHEILQESV